MNFNVSLFERLADKTQKTDLNEDERITASIATHLAKLLGTRAGSVKTRPDYGLPDLNNASLSAHDTARQSRLAIEKVIRDYEPRLYEVHVMTDESAGCVLKRTFSIDASLDMNGVKKTVVFSIAVAGDGNVILN
ncbi:hypothetical protein A264_15036 [Pseudomonas syringae pv. actinidiae ICMP 19071]|uniref:type VI secretion system baseplate subunit TssE n=1 Tax=Pseudomonas syringae TaxID=317 RepID=UPI000357833B|nr:type VI secretion system baseplate subunit TssE [Pseudomonas syringae]EPM59130.1 hypothetical protein A264_15036 [Pseudomonas syringae pv. actinidiae ICMP 19071]EPM62697.1 hypothetical protein A262_05177 [Pseudomonas syringae pv. actinidiae ICMP 19073]EPM75253.1 hypothetical protein A3SO_22202 [Pseudomonas syringae pv. actinidiae ICMP 19072]OSN65000.1 hypothetical protein BV349_03343 [Pseudomonas syringae pv. actinidiae]OSN75963.1 hypothetical protein BV351_03220 [Pseudomonas syringae pv. a